MLVEWLKVATGPSRQAGKVMANRPILNIQINDFCVLFFTWLGSQMERKCKLGALKCMKWELQASWSNFREMTKLFKVQNPKGFKHLDAEEIMGLERFYSEDIYKLKEVVKEF